MFACLDPTDFIHFYNFTLNLFLKYIRINKSLICQSSANSPSHGTVRVTALFTEHLTFSCSLGKALFRSLSIQDWLRVVKRMGPINE